MYTKHVTVLISTKNNKALSEKADRVMASNATETCVACSKGEVAFAKGFQRTREAVEEYYECVGRQWIEYDMPPRDTTGEWKVYKLSSQKMFVHFSLFFKCESPEYQQSPGFTIELRTSKLRKTVHPHTELKSISTKHLTCFGTIIKSAEEIMRIGLKSLETMITIATTAKISV